MKPKVCMRPWPGRPIREPQSSPAGSLFCASGVVPPVLEKNERYHAVVMASTPHGQSEIHRGTSMYSTCTPYPLCIVYTIHTSYTIHIPYVVYTLYILYIDSTYTIHTQYILCVIYIPRYRKKSADLKYRTLDIYNKPEVCIGRSYKKKQMPNTNRASFLRTRPGRHGAGPGGPLVRVQCRR